MASLTERFVENKPLWKPCLWKVEHIQANIAAVRKKTPAGPFSKEQETRFARESGVCRNTTQVRHNFRKQFFQTNPKAVPQRYTFQRIVKKV